MEGGVVPDAPAYFRSSWNHPYFTKSFNPFVLATRSVHSSCSSPPPGCSYEAVRPRSDMAGRESLWIRKTLGMAVSPATILAQTTLVRFSLLRTAFTPHEFTSIYYSRILTRFNTRWTGADFKFFSKRIPTYVFDIRLRDVLILKMIVQIDR